MYDIISEGEFCILIPNGLSGCKNSGDMLFRAFGIVPEKNFGMHNLISIPKMGYLRMLRGNTKFKMPLYKFLVNQRRHLEFHGDNTCTCSQVF